MNYLGMSSLTLQGYEAKRLFSHIFVQKPQPKSFLSRIRHEKASADAEG